VTKERERIICILKLTRVNDELKFCPSLTLKSSFKTIIIIIFILILIQVNDQPDS